ncbi:Tetraspanin-9, partial [Bienertia sinuspersici]
MDLDPFVVIYATTHIKIKVKDCLLILHSLVVARLQEVLELESGDHCSEDCHRWDNDPNTLCFDCESCKAGFLQDITKVWLGPGIGLVCIGVILLGLLIV